MFQSMNSTQIVWSLYSKPHFKLILVCKKKIKKKRKLNLKDVHNPSVIDYFATND